MNIDRLTAAELIDLNRRIVERLTRMDSMRQQHQMMAFHIGQRVFFDYQRSRYHLW